MTDKKTPAEIALKQIHSLLGSINYLTQFELDPEKRTGVLRDLKAIKRKLTIINEAFADERKEHAETLCDARRSGQ